MGLSQSLRRVFGVKKKRSYRIHLRFHFVSGRVDSKEAAASGDFINDTSKNSWQKAWPDKEVGTKAT